MKTTIKAIVKQALEEGCFSEDVNEFLFGLLGYGADDEVSEGFARWLSMKLRIRSASMLVHERNNFHFIE